MSKKGRAKRTSGIPKSTPSLSAVTEVDALPSSATEVESPSETDVSRLSDEGPAPSSARQGSRDAPTSAEKAESASHDSKDETKAEDAPNTETSKESAKAESTKDESSSPDGAKAEGSKDAEAEGISKKEGAKRKGGSVGRSGESADRQGGVDDEAFFSEGHRRSSMPPPVEDAEDERTIRLREDPEVLERRARSVRVVRILVAAFALLLGLGVVKKLTEAPPAPPPAPVFAKREPEVSAPSEAPSVPGPASATAASAAGMDASPSAETDASAGADAASSASLDASADAAVVLASQDGGQVADADVVVDAKALKKAAQRALDNGKLAVAIENGEASVAADPTDGEAWLLLGAAYEQKGRVADARAAYQSCVSKGKRGPTGECAALLR
jgi:hypothetical protein